MSDNYYVGHALATYTLESYFNLSEEHPVEGGWQNIIIEAIESTKLSHSKAELVCLVDKKAFKAPARTAISDLLDSLNIKWGYTISSIIKNS
jgi:D-tyrosyl-tRNA(Tyr) deacylase